VFSVFLTFVPINNTSDKITILFCVCCTLAVIYLILWYYYNRLKSIKLSIDNSDIIIKEGDIFNQEGLKTIGFNEYFDTIVDDKIIAKNSLNGKFINKYFSDANLLNDYIQSYDFKESCLNGENEKRLVGNKFKFNLGTICVYNDEYLLTAFSYFDENNRAYLSMTDYLTFLLNFWDSVNVVYAQRCVSVPIFGSGITRIKGHSYISDEDLLKIMIWTFKISEMKFKHPANLTIIISKDKIDRINLFELKGSKTGL
jgi:hypothetical protein